VASVRIDDIVGSVDGFDPGMLDVLDSDDLADALSRALDPDDPSRVRALEILARVDPENAAAAVGQMLEQGADPPSLAGAIGALAAAGPLATPLALATVASDAPEIASLSWMTLQRTATGDDLAVIGPLAQQAADEVLDHAQFTQSVIAYRAGLEGFELPLGELLELGPDAETLFIETGPTDEFDFELLFRLSSPELYGLSLSRDATTTIDCGDAHMLLALDEGILGALPGRLDQAPALVGLIAVLDAFGTSYSVCDLVLTWPDREGGLNVAVHTPGGTQEYFGTGSSADDTVNLDLRSVVQPGAVPVEIGISATSAGIEFTQAVSATEVSDLTPRLDLEPDPDE
jgi:hypothetical protein